MEGSLSRVFEISNVISDLETHLGFDLMTFRGRPLEISWPGFDLELLAIWECLQNCLSKISGRWGCLERFVRCEFLAIGSRAIREQRRRG